MKTDKQVYSIFSLNPRWLFELTGLVWPGPCQWKSVAFKSIEQTADGVLYPDAPDSPITVTEIQAQFDPFIYARVVIEMAMLQREERNRDVQGVVLFFSQGLDPKIAPWDQVGHSFYLDEILAELATRQPDHPLVAVFQPVIQLDDKTLEDSAATCYNQIKTSNLPPPAIETLLAAFVNWLEQRFFKLGKQEIENMLLGELPDLRETQSGKDLIAIGKSEGKIEGKIEGLLLQLSAKFGDIDPEMRQRIEGLQSAEIVNRLLMQVVKINSIDQLTIE